MRHLFIINPAAGRVKRNMAVLERQIRLFFRSHPEIKYDIYITKWCRDAVGFTRAYIMNMYGAGDFGHLRVHAMGGPGTLYEIVNAVIGVSNVSVAAYPLGSENSFLKHFGSKKLFASIEKQVFSQSVPIDIIRCGHNFGVNASNIGLMARANMQCGKMTERGWSFGLSYAFSIFIYSINHPAKHYKVKLDGECLDGDYISIAVANGQYLGKSFRPAPDALPVDGLFDVYFVNKIPRWKLVTYLEYYLTGQHKKAPSGLLSHYRGRNLTVSSEDGLNMCIDGENFNGSQFEYELLESAVNFVCPDVNNPHGRKGGGGND